MFDLPLEIGNRLVVMYQVFMRSILMIVGCIILVPFWVMAENVPSMSSRDSEIRAVVMDYVKQKAVAPGCEIRLKKFSLSGNPIFPEGSLDYEILAPQQWDGWGHANLAVIVRRGDRVVQNLSVRIEVEALAEMVVTSRQIDNGTIITASDLVLRKLDLASVQGRYIGRIEDVTGKKARMTLKGNFPVKADQLEKIPLIKPGQLVTIIAENERMRITVTGKAKNAGAAGDTITVQNLNSLKEIPARVIDAGTVMVVF